MVKVNFDSRFQEIFLKIKDNTLKDKVIRQIEKIKLNPEVGKLMMHDRRGTKELYVAPFRLSYTYIKHEDRVIILDLYPKKEQ
jgi:mRNA-degrading endonuclease RelE of RelBE toxin-antitoxin system